MVIWSKENWDFPTISKEALWKVEIFQEEVHLKYLERQLFGYAGHTNCLSRLKESFLEIRIQNYHCQQRKPLLFLIYQNTYRRLALAYFCFRYARHILVKTPSISSKYSSDTISYFCLLQHSAFCTGQWTSSDYGHTLWNPDKQVTRNQLSEHLFSHSLSRKPWSFFQLKTSPK